MAKRLVLMGEGQGELHSLPNLVARLIAHHGGDDVLYVDHHVMRVKGIHHLAASDFANWKRYLAVAMKRRELGGILLVLDGDSEFFPAGTRDVFCAASAARCLTQIAAAHVAAADRLAVVFACQEYESWLIAGMPSLTGREFSGRALTPTQLELPASDLEVAPRDAKKWLAEHLPSGYSPTRDQVLLTQAVDLNAVRASGMRSFQRLEHAIIELIDASRNGRRTVTPSLRP